MREISIDIEVLERAVVQGRLRQRPPMLRRSTATSANQEEEKEGAPAADVAPGGRRASAAWMGAKERPAFTRFITEAAVHRSFQVTRIRELELIASTL